MKPSPTQTLLLLLPFLWAQGGSAYEVVDSQGKHWFDAVPQRVVATDWTVLENLIELGVTPVGAPELDLFRALNPAITVHEDVADIGLRLAPTLGAIEALAPDLIIVGSSQKSLTMPLSRIARTLYYKSFSDRYRTNGDKSLVRFRQMAVIFQQEKRAEELLSTMAMELEDTRLQLEAATKNPAPDIVLVRLLSSDKCLVYGHNSLPHFALQKVGLATPVGPGETAWGEIEMPISELARFSESLLLYFTPLPFDAPPPAWQALPQVDQGRSVALPPIWTRGSALSVGRIATAVGDAIGKRVGLTAPGHP
ncbi:MAG: ABC transporter substrate-binding protein [Pseudomonadota bacterium]